jgi:hypothetical protein
MAYRNYQVAQDATRAADSRDGNMNGPAERTGKSTGDFSPFVRAAGTFAARRADAGVISRRTDGSTGPAPGKRPESSGGGSKRTVIWGMPD